MTRLAWGPITLPYEYTGPRDEYLACRRSAWLGIALNTTPIYDVTGPDAVKLFNQTCVNKDFSLMKVGNSKHALICNDKGQMNADGVIMKIGENLYRTYWMAPVLQYCVETSGLDVQGSYVTDEFFLQLDGPKSLEILETAFGINFHDLKFAHNKTVDWQGAELIVHRLGMSGALAYEIHGKQQDFNRVYPRLREVLFQYDGRLQGFRNYCTVNHTTAGYPNQNIHFIYPYYDSEPELAEWTKANHIAANTAIAGSASDDIQNAYATPYDVGWGYLVNFNHEFRGKAALQQLKQNSPYKMVTLEWNADDVADVFKSQFEGKREDMYEPIEYFSGFDDMSQGMATHIDYVMSNGEKVGIASGRTYAYYENRMISLAKIKPELAALDNEVEVLWGGPNYKQKLIRAKVAPFPYYNGEYRNEHFDVSAIPELA
ncbi:MAG: hypothetical protein ACOYJL_07025 [Tractidigestivibacter sp.]